LIAWILLGSQIILRTEKPNAIYKSSSDKFKTSFFRASDAKDLISIHIYGIVEKTPQNVT
jgi:hypothetical protein